MSAISAPGAKPVRSRRAPGSHRAVRYGSCTGTWFMVRLTLRRSLWFWGAWILALWATMLGTESAYHTLVGDPVTSAGLLAELASSATMRAMLGPPYDLATSGGFVMWRVGTFVAAGAAMMAALGVIRATRGEEEVGRTELLRSGVVGRNAPLAGALIVAVGACALLGGLIGIGMAAVAPPAISAFAGGAGIAAVGACWAGIGAVTAQVSQSARSARGLALGALAVAYVVRAVADGLPADHSLRGAQWVSPVEWAALVRAYADERWWVLALPVTATGLLIALAFALAARRDHGAGLRPVALGPSFAGRDLNSVAGLALRLDRGLIIGWVVGMSLYGMAIGSLSGSVTSMLDQSPTMADLWKRMGGSTQMLQDSFYSTMLGITVVVVAVFAVQLMGRMRSEEVAGHTEALASTATSRTQLLAAHLVPALVIPTLVLGLTGVMLAVPQALTDGSVGVLGTIAGAALVLAPGMWLVVGVTVAVIGWAPRAMALPWVLVAWSGVMSWVGALLNLPDALVSATPFQQLPKLPVAQMDWTPVLIETGLALVLIVVGWVGFRRRDLPQ